MAVQRQSGLEAQGIACTKANRNHPVLSALCEDRRPELRRRVGIDEHLETVLPGVARAGHDHLDAGHLRPCTTETSERGHSGGVGGKRGDNLDRSRPLQREQTVPVAGVLDRTLAVRTLADPRNVALRVRSCLLYTSDAADE